MTYRVIDIAGYEPVAPAQQPAPQLMWVDIAALVIDERYQRPLARGNQDAIRRIAADFRWSRFSPVLVAPIEGGRYAVIDGQHRVHAAAICGFAQVPAMIALVAPTEQALAFVEINTSQIKVSGFHLLRAALQAGEAWAVKCSEAVAAAGCRLMLSNAATKDKKAGQVFAVALIRNLVGSGHTEAVTAGLRALLNFEPENVANFDGTLLAPWLGAVASDDAFPKADLAAFLQANRPWLVIERANRFAKAEAVPLAKARRDAFTILLRNWVKDHKK